MIVIESHGKRVISTIYSVFNIVSLLPIFYFSTLILAFFIGPDLYILVTFQIFNPSIEMISLILSTLITVFLCGIAKLCEIRRENYTYTKRYNFFGLFSEIHLRDKSMYGKILPVIKDVNIIIKRNPNKNYLLIHNFVGVYERFSKLETFTKKFEIHGGICKSYLIPWLYIVGMMFFFFEYYFRRSENQSLSKVKSSRFIRALKTAHRSSLCFAAPIVIYPQPYSCNKRLSDGRA